MLILDSLIRNLFCLKVNYTLDSLLPIEPRPSSNLKCNFAARQADEKQHGNNSRGLLTTFYRALISMSKHAEHNIVVPTVSRCPSVSPLPVLC